MVQNLVHNLCESLVTNIGNIADTGGATPAPPTPITYLTQWQMMGNSEVHGNEIWSCGEYSAVDGKYHILVQPQGGSIADIALDEPLRKVNDVADSIEFSNGSAVVTRNIAKVKWNELTIVKDNQVSNYDRFKTDSLRSVILLPESTVPSRTNKCLSADFVQDTAPINKKTDVDQCMAAYNTGSLYIRDTSVSNNTEFQAKYGTHELLYRLATPTTETIQVPQIQKADSYSMVISQGGKAVSWSSFETE